MELLALGKGIPVAVDEDTVVERAGVDELPGGVPMLEKETRLALAGFESPRGMHLLIGVIKSLFV